MNYELLSKLALEEAEKSKNENSILKRRNEILHNEVERLESLVKKIEQERVSLKDEVDTLKDEVISLKSVLEFKDDENQHYPHYSWVYYLYFKLVFEIQISVYKKTIESPH